MLCRLVQIKDELMNEANTGKTVISIINTKSYSKESGILFALQEKNIYTDKLYIDKLSHQDTDNNLTNVLMQSSKKT